MRIKIYHPVLGDRAISAIDFTKAWRDRGWSNTPVNEAPALIETPTNGGSVALELINMADNPEDLTPIPTVGIGAAKVILDARPEGGYTKLSDLPKELFAQPYRCSYAEIESWIG